MASGMQCEVEPAVPQRCDLDRRFARQAHPLRSAQSAGLVVQSSGYYRFLSFSCASIPCVSPSDWGAWAVPLLFVLGA